MQVWFHKRVRQTNQTEKGKKMTKDNQITLRPTSHNHTEAFEAYMNHILTDPNYSTEDRIKYSRLAATDECWLLDTVEGCGITFEKALKDITIRKFQNLMRKESGFYLNEPQPCNGDKSGNWGAYDSTGRYWQDSCSGSPYDDKSYIRSCVRAYIWEEIANEKGYTII